MRFHRLRYKNSRWLDSFMFITCYLRKSSFSIPTTIILFMFLYKSLPPIKFPISHSLTSNFLFLFTFIDCRFIRYQSTMLIIFIIRSIEFFDLISNTMLLNRYTFHLLIISLLSNMIYIISELHDPGPTYVF